MYNNLKPSDEFTLLDRIAPISQGAGAVNGAWVKVEYNKLLAEIEAGVLGVAATLDGKLQQATDGAGTGAKDITGAVITQMVKATDDGKSASINLGPDRLDVAGGFCYVRLVVTVGVAASLIAARLYGCCPGYGPGTHAASRKENVSVF